MAMLRLNLLGPPEVHLGEIRLSFPTRKTFAVLIYLALEKRPQPREHLAALFWPEASTERSHASLRNTLGHLQAVLRQASEVTESGYLSVTYGTLALHPEAQVLIDLDLVEQAYQHARTDRSSRTPREESADPALLMAAANQYRGDFLVGFSLSDAPEFDAWASNQRESWRRRLGLIFDRLSEVQFVQGDLASAAESAALWITLDSLNEGAYRRKMRAHFAAGERGQALETYELCRASLLAELGVEPDPETELLAARIRAQHPVRSADQRTQINTPVAFLESLFAGRSPEQQALLAQYEAAVSGQAQVVVLRGEAGIGKTRLSTEFLNRARAQGAEVLQGRAFEGGGGISYHPLVEAFRAYIERNGAQKEWVTESWLPSISRLLPQLSDPSMGTGSLAEVDQAQLFEALLRLTLALSARFPLLIFVDDLQWADRATLDWLLYAVRRWSESKAPLLLLVSLRSEALQPSTQPETPSLIDWLEQLEREVDAHSVELGPLGEQETIQMLLSIITAPAADFVQWLFSETRGQPFYLMETLKDLLERKALHPRQHGEGQWVFEIDSEHELGKAVRLPSTIRAVLRSRLNRISPNAFALLSAAAVLEHGMSFDLLCAIARLNEDAGLSALDELLSRRLLVEHEWIDRPSMYEFANDMIRDFVYTEAGDARRRLFHRRALELLETEQVSAAVLAHHAIAAGLPEAAFRHSLDAGQEALRLAAAREAQIHLEKARQLVIEEAPDLTEIQPQKHDLYRGLAQAYELGGQAEQARAMYEELRKLTSE